ncbi:hypothetical protein SAMN05444365_11469 [Micromonospora pattaloongensis]|uniref:Uncharacterized protein n=1 Tax=Micromonospora pattaloongensis TaxID=405436 RepID=A0A1H3SXF1_9ACTN|nr:transcriptional regulator [Micromonospora pattaloongensis]SDZ41779.1 hypothetical protein SAMN05444365_11469 [Micromonospora pattaloongensis]
MSVRAFAGHLGVAVASVTNWEQRGELIRLRHETQEVLDRDLSRADDDVRRRFEAALNELKAMVVPVAASDSARRLEYVLAHPSRADAMTVAYLRKQVARLDAAYDHQPSATLLGPAGERHAQIAYLRAWASNGRIQRELLATFAASAILMGQLVWDASLRRDHASALSYFDAVIEAADGAGDPLLAARGHLRRSLVALYGQWDARTGLEMAAQAAATSCSVSNALAGLALLHVAEAYAMRQQRRPCESALSAADTYFGKVTAADGAGLLLSPFDASRMAGACYLHLDEAAKATAFLTETLTHAGRTKAAAVAAANLALALTRDHKIDDAVDSLHRAIDIVEATRGGGGLTVAFTAGRALNPWRQQAAVQDVHDRLLALVAT